MIHIYTIRQYYDSFDKEYKTARKPFGKSGKSVESLFSNVKSFIETIPDTERWNLHYSLASYEDEGLTGFLHQKVIPIDFDGIDVERIDEYIKITEEVIRVKRDNLGIVASGNGLHILIGLKAPITKETYFKENLAKYKLLCGEINSRLFSKGLIGSIDTGPFRSRATLRLPETRNIKEGIPDTDCVLLNGTITPAINSLDDIIDAEVIAENIQELKEYPKPDATAVQEKCLFLKHCLNEPDSIKEPQWYAMLTIISKLDDTLELCHSYSQGHSKYSAAGTQEKAEYAKEVGPRTCSNISSLWSGCSSCEHFNKCVSPITLKGDDHIATAETGFHHVITDKNGATKHIPDFEGLRKYFNQKHNYIVTDSKFCYIWKGSHWEHYKDIYIETFAQDHFEPAANNHKINEFVRLVLRTNVRPEEWFENSTQGKMNFKNGILDLHTMQFGPHAQDLGFRSTLPYNYEPEAECPTFNTFLEEVTCNDKQLEDLLMEFAGYAFSGIRCMFDKALLLNGWGANGKSTFLRVLTAAAGEGAYSSLTLPEMFKEQNREQMVGKLFNVSEEAPSRQGLDSATFKNIVSGGEMTVKVVYKTPFRIKNKAFTTSESSEKALADYKELTDSIERWVSENISWTDVEYDRDIPDLPFTHTETIYQKYVFAMEMNRERPESYKRFVTKANKILPISRKDRRRISGAGRLSSPKAGYYGVQFLTENSGNNREF